MTREALEAQLLQLPPDERAHLARVLIESLDDQPELDPAWLEEAELRAESVQAIPAATVLANARRRLTG